MKDKEKTLDLILRAFAVFDNRNCHSEDLSWITDKDGNLETLYIQCSDLFYWASVDGQDLNADNIGELEKALKDVQAVLNRGGHRAIPLLFCCRMRGMRPQLPYYKYIPEELHHLFNACGEERDV